MKVSIKTNLLPFEIEVYDSTKPQQRSPLAEFIKLGVVIRDDNGRVIVAYPEYPATSQAVSWGTLLMIGLLAYKLLR